MENIKIEYQNIVDEKDLENALEEVEAIVRQAWESDRKATLKVDLIFDKE